MAWWNSIFKSEEEKLNTSQPLIALTEGRNVDTREKTLNYVFFYEHLEVVNRAVNMIVDDVAQIPTIVLDEKVKDFKRVTTGVRRATVEKLLNKQPNRFQDVNTFKRNLIIDYLIDGNIFIYWDGQELFHLPSSKTAILPDEKNYIKGYVYDNRIDYSPDEIIHVKENSFHSIYRGVPRLKPAERTMKLLYDMRQFQDQFFKNGAIPGLVLKVPYTLSERNKERTIENWMAKYNPKTGGFRPMILDGGAELKAIHDIDFKKIGFQESMIDNEKIILEALGVPQILFIGGNNANIRPNHRLFYLETILPIVRKLNYALERFFGFSLTEDISNIPALQPELKEQASFYSTLVNGGILTPNEGRVGVGVQALEDQDMDTIRIPANIAGSAVNPSEGGKPEEGEDDG